MFKHLYDEIAKRWLNGCDSIWIYSDPHFGDLESYKLRFPEEFHFTGEDRPANDWIVEYLDKKQTKKINSIIGKNDVIIFLGDIGDIECIKKIKGYKILIMGNHDKGASNYKREVVNTSQLLCWRLEFKGINPPLCLSKDYSFEQAKNIGLEMGQLKNIVPVYNQEDNHLFDEVYEGPLMINDRLILSHEPIEQLPDYMFNIHGHDHSKWFSSDRHMNVCAENIDYTPVNLISLIKNGLLKNVENIHRKTIDSATKRKRKKELNKINRMLKELNNKNV